MSPLAPTFLLIPHSAKEEKKVKPSTHAEKERRLGRYIQYGPSLVSIDIFKKKLAGTTPMIIFLFNLYLFVFVQVKFLRDSEHSN
jgi:hypothetical protein